MRRVDREMLKEAVLKVCAHYGVPPDRVPQVIYGTAAMLEKQAQIGKLMPSTAGLSALGKFLVGLFVAAPLWGGAMAGATLANIQGGLDTSDIKDVQAEDERRAYAQAIEQLKLIQEKQKKQQAVTSRRPW